MVIIGAGQDLKTILPLKASHCPMANQSHYCWVIRPGLTLTGDGTSQYCLTGPIIPSLTPANTYRGNAPYNRISKDPSTRIAIPETPFLDLYTFSKGKSFLSFSSIQ